MRTQTPLFQLSAALAVTGLVLGPLTADLAHAQAAQTASAGDPPARVGRLASLAGTVSFHTAAQTEWQAAALNYPVTSGNAFWTEPGAAAAIEIEASHIALAEATEFDVDTLDDNALAATQPQGEVYLRIPSVQPNETYTIVTPRGSVLITGTARVDIVAGSTDTPTMVTVVDGSVQMSGPNLSLTIGAHQTATISGTDTFQGSVGAESDDAFLTAQLRLEQPVATATATATASVSYTPPPMVQAMTGAADLQTTGSWADAPDYGHVWYPPVQSDWVPYRDGHWANVAPWGWTWVDNASWGFAPFHYGRWVQVNDRWGWTPGDAARAEGDFGYRRPVYAPALVNFVGIGVAAAVGAAVGLAAGRALSGNIGWAPLGYREPYIPPYYVSRPYLAGINAHYVPRTDLTRVTNNYGQIYSSNRTVNTTVINNYYGHEAAARLADRRAATFVPAATLARSEPVRQHALRVTPQEIAQARPIATLPVRAETVRPARPAPGPAVAPMPRLTRQTAPASLPRPALAPRPLAGQPMPGTPPRPAMTPAPRPGALPPLAPSRAAGAAGRPPAAAPGPAVVPRPAPGPVIRPAPARPQPTSVAPPPPAPHPAAPATPTPSAAPRPAAAASPHPVPRPEAATPGSRPALPVPRAAPVPVARPAPSPVPHTVPAPHAAPAPAPRPAPSPAPRAAPAPSPAPRAAPAPAPRPTPAPVPRATPAPAPRPAPSPAPRAAPAPAPRPAPAPPPRPAPPPPHRPCPPGIKAC